MKLIIAGGRHYAMTQEDFDKLTDLLSWAGVTEVVSGGATGADLHGEFWAKEHGIPVKKFRADWLIHGRAAGPIRNREMAGYADALAVFPGGRGTESMVAEAKKAGLRIFDFRNLDGETL